MPEIEWTVEDAPAPSEPGTTAPVTGGDLLTFRDAIRRISPPWLVGGVGEKVLYAIAIHLDLLMDGLVAGVRSRFPNVHSGESLSLIGKERRILRGSNETAAVYASRLRRWLDDHQSRGGPYALLAQLHAHFASNSFPIDLVYYSGRRFSLTVDGSVTYDDISWDPGGSPSQWARWWLYYHWPDPVVDDGLWGDPGTWGDGGAWSLSLTFEEVQILRAVPSEWNAAHALGRIVFLTSDVELWGFPAGTWGDPGTWGSEIPVEITVG